MMILSYAMGIFGIGFLIFIHELGHFLFCKLFNIPATKFAIGMGPHLFSKKYKGTEYSIGLIPIGGFVQIGKEGEEENENEDEVLFKNTFWKTTLVLWGGVLFNLAFAYITITSIVCFDENKIEESNLKLFYPQKHMIIKDKEDNSIYLNYSCYLDLIKEFKDSEFTLEDCEGEKIVFESKAFFDSHFKIENTIKKKQSLLEKIIFGITLTNNIIKQTFFGIIQLFKGLNINKLSGPLGIMNEGRKIFNKGFIDYFIYLAFISTSLAILNILPIPILDGGKFLLLAIYKIIRRRIPTFLEFLLTYGSLAIIAVMTLFSTYNDIIKIFFGS
jgi:regulator of sigma E protease